MKGILLAGGANTRLYPITKSISKQLLPVYDKPMVYYPLSVLMLAGIRDVLIITTPHDQPLFKKLLGNGTQLGLTLTYATQPSPEGIAQAFIIGEQFIGKSAVSLILGDNIFYGYGLSEKLEAASKLQQGALIFGSYVKHPERYGVMAFDKKQNLIDIIEKPQQAPSHYAVAGLYFYDHSVVKKAKQLQPSARGELEITDLNKCYLAEKKLQYQFLGRGTAWLDTGTPAALLAATNFIATIEHRQGLKIACIEEIAFRKGYITADQCLQLAKPLQKTSYGQYLLRRVHEAKLTELALLGLK